MTAVEPSTPQRAQDSLRWRLPLVIAAVVVLLVGLFLAAAYREVRTNLVQAAGVRAQGAANRLATLLTQSTQQRVEELRRAASHPAIRELLQHPNEETRQAAQAQIGRLPSPSSQLIEVWTSGGANVLSLSMPPGSEGALPAGSAPTAAGIGKFHVHRGALITEAVTAVAPDTSIDATDAAAPATLGFVVVRRPIALSTSADALSGLVGNGAVVKIGNRDGAGWTDLSKVIDAPPVDLAQTGTGGYDGPDGQRYVGAMAAIGGTPWAVWVEFPQSVVLAPAQSFLRRMLVVALAAVIVAVLFLRAMTERMLGPLSELTHASEAIAGGEYSRRVGITRRDEIGRLGITFNAMTEHVEQAHRELEDRVRRRTATLEETTATLAQRVQELKDSRGELDHFFSLTPDMLGITDIEGRFMRVNAAWYDTLGWSPEDLLAAPFVSFVHPDDVEATARASARFADGDATLTFENRYRCKDGSFRWLSWKAAPVVSRGLVYAAVRDITEQKRAARELEERATELESVNRELEAFSYSVSHDLRAPLRHIGGFAALLSQSAATSLDADGHRLLGTIINAATRMGRLIDDLLAFSRVGRTPLERGEVSLNPLIRDVQREIMTGLNGPEVVWRVHDLPSVRGDRALLRLVFMNLLSNAVKYSSKRPQAEIEVGALPGAPDEVVLFVRDNGVGFDMQYASKLFGVFQRLHSAEEFEGTGIGLANVRRIVHRHGGKVWAESELNRGAAFFVTLPPGTAA